MARTAYDNAPNCAPKIDLFHRRVELRLRAVGPKMRMNTTITSLEFSCPCFSSHHLSCACGVEVDRATQNRGGRIGQVLLCIPPTALHALPARVRVKELPIVQLN